MGLSLGGIARFAGNAAAPAADVAAAQLQAQANAANDRTKNALQAYQLQKKEEHDQMIDALTRAQTTHLGAQTSALNEGTYEKAEPMMRPDGTSVMMERHKQTGVYRPIRVEAGDDATPSPAPAGSVSMPAPKAAALPAMTQGAPQPAPVDANGMPAAPVQASPTPRPAASQVMRPYVKPTPIPYNLTPEGMKADSVRVAMTEGAKKPFQRDPVKDHEANKIFDNAHPAPGAGVQFLTTPGKDGNPVYAVGDKNARTITPTDVGAKPSGAGGGSLSGQTMQTMARMGTSYNDLKQAIDQMDAYENKPGNLSSQTPFKQALGTAAEVHPGMEAHGIGGSLGNMAASYIGAKAGEKLGKDDPEYRTYLNNKQRVATAFTELLPRPNQQLLQLEKGLSGADVSWNPQMIQNIQLRRRGGLSVLQNILAEKGMLDDQGNMTGKSAKGSTTTQHAAPSTGNIDLRTPTAAPAKAGAKDYGIFGKPE